MATDAILGTHIIELVTDATKLTKGLNQAERDSKQTAGKIASTVGADIEKGFERARAAVPKLTGAMKSGLGAALTVTEKLSRGALLTEKDLLRIKVALERVKNGAVSSFGSIENASRETTDAIRAMESALERGTDELRRQKNIAGDTRGAVSQAGLAYASMGQAVEQAAGKHGHLVAKSGLVVFALREAIGTFDSLNRAMGLGEGTNLRNSYLKAWAEDAGKLVTKLSEAVVVQSQLAADILVGGDGRYVRQGQDENLLAPTAPRGRFRGQTAQKAFDLGARDWGTDFGPTSWGEEVQKAIERRAKADEDARKKSLAIIAQAAADRRAGEAALAGLLARYNAEKLPAQNAERARNDADSAAYLARQKEIQSIRVAFHEAATARILELARLEAQIQVSSLDRISAAYAENATDLQDVMGQAVYGVEGLFTDVLAAGVEGNLEGIQDSFKNFFQNLSRQIVNFLAQQAVMKLLTMMGGSTIPGGGTNMSGLSALMGASPGVASANGNVLRGGFRAFANGGIVNRPTLGLIGEGRFNEAVVPLPDGRSIPVESRGARAPQPINVTVEWTPEFIRGIVGTAAAKGAEMANRQVVGIVANDLDGNGRLRRVIQGTI